MPLPFSRPTFRRNLSVSIVPRVTPEFRRSLYEKFQSKHSAKLRTERLRFLAVATFENETHFVSHIAVARDGDGCGVRHSGDRLEISAGRVFAAGHGCDVFRHRPDRRDDSRVRIAEVAAGDL